MPETFDPQAAAQDYSTGMRNAGPKIERGVRRVTQSPGQAAAAQREVWAQKMADPATVNKWAQRVAAVPTSEWQEAMLTTGRARATAANPRAERKMQRYLQEFAAALPTLRAALPARGNRDANRQRMLSWFDQMVQYGESRTAGIR